MDLTEETNQGSEKQTERSDSQKQKRRRCSRLCFCLVVVLAFGACAFYLYSKITAPIDVKNASTVQAVGWLTMRDLSQETPQTREDLFQMYVGDATIPDVESESGKSFELPDGVKKITGIFLKDRDKKVNAWTQTNKRAPYLRLDYLIVPRQIEDRASRYVLSDDVQPGSSLKARWTRSREALKEKDAPKKSYVEKNVQLLVMQWFVARRNEYDSTPDEQKRQKLESTADELTRMQGFYNKLRGTQAALTRVQMLREFESTMESWNEIATVEELAKTLWFKDLLVSVAASKSAGLGADVAPYPPLLPEKYRATAEKEEDARNARLEFVKKAKPVCDVVRNYFFDAAK